MYHISDLTPDPQNARRHNPRNIGMIERSLNEVGAARSIVIDEDNVILAGNGLIEAAAQAGIENVRIIEASGDEIIAVRRSGLTAEQKTKLALFDNRTNELSDWEPGVLAEIAAQGVDLSVLFTPIEWADVSMPALPESGAGGDEFDTTPDDGPTRAQLGDLWIIGGVHRLLVGDCTDPANVDRLMGVERAQLCFTSPPYAAQREYEIGVFDWDMLMDGATLGLFEYLTPNASLLVNLGMVHSGGRVDRYWDGWIARMESAGNPLYGWYVWDQGWGLPGDWAGRLAPSFEFLFHFAKKPRHTGKTEDTISAGKIRNSTFRHADGSLQPFTGNGQPTGTTKVADSVIRINRQIGGVDGGDHPAVFSVAFPEHCIPIWTNTNDPVYDPFLGSGTTLIAAHRTGRRCYGMEIAPRYADVILRRAEAEGLTCELSHAEH